MSPSPSIPVAIEHRKVQFIRLAEVTHESSLRNTGREFSEVRSVTNSKGLVRTSDFFGNTRTSSDTSGYKVVRPAMFVYNPSRVNVGSIGWLNESAPVIVSPMYVVFEVDTKRILPEYLILFLSSRSGRSQIEGRTEVGARFRLTYASMSQIRIPLPPLETQRQIVQLLSTFSDLETALETELKARRHQFAYYRELLITKLDPAATSWMPMGKVGEFIRGRRFVKDDYAESGTPCIHYGEIYTFYGTAATSTSTHLRENMYSQLRFARPSDVIIAAVGETAADVGKGVAWLGSSDVAIHDDCFLFRHSLDPKFVSYYLQTDAFHSQKGKYVSRAKVKRLSKAGLENIFIPVPSLDEQERIVAVLEKFDALVNDKSIGLPAELEARRKQYEYYRDQLLTFKEAAA